jgi:hypothetical protein
LEKEYKTQLREGADSEKYESVKGDEYSREYLKTLEVYDKKISDMSDKLDFKDIEGSKPMFDLMQEAIDKINELKDKHNKP